MRKLRWGVIGAGGIADRRTIPGMLMAANAELVAVMEINPGHAQSLKNKYGAFYAYDNEAELLNNNEVDAVYIASPVVVHAEQAIMAAKAGKHILLEKPVAMTGDEGEAVLDCCAKNGVKIAAGFMMRFGTHVLNMKQAIADGRIGTIVSGYSQFTLWLPDGSGNWRSDKSKAGGGTLMDLGVHCIDLIEYITNLRVTHVGALCETTVFTYDVEDSATVLMRMENGAQCVVQANFNIPDEAAKWRLEFFGTKGRLIGEAVIGQNDGGKLNAIFLDQQRSYDSLQDYEDDQGVEIAGEFGNMYAREIESFSDSVLNNKPLIAPASDAVHVQRIVEAAYKSSTDHKIYSV